MKRPEFSLKKFAEKNVTTFTQEELRLISGGRQAEDWMCSQESDTDSGRNCSLSNDTDTVDAEVPVTP